jgi:TPR repeat protein
VSAINYYNEIIKQDVDIDIASTELSGNEASLRETNDSSAVRSEINDILSTAMFELSGVLEEQSLSLSTADYSFHLLVRAAEKGHSGAQHTLAASYATGIHTGLVPMDASRSLILDFMSALGGDPLANMAMGYRYLNGIGVPESCEKAQVFYEYAANEAAQQISRRGYPLYSERALLSDLESSGMKGRKEMDPEVIYVT